jgi:hypothetical protein
LSRLTPSRSAHRKITPFKLAPLRLVFLKLASLRSDIPYLFLSTGKYVCHYHFEHNQRHWVSKNKYCELQWWQMSAARKVMPGKSLSFESHIENHIKAKLEESPEELLYAQP